MSIETTRKSTKNGYHQHHQAENHRKIMERIKGIKYIHLFMCVIGITWIICMVYTANRVHSTSTSTIHYSSINQIHSNFSVSVGTNRTKERNNDDVNTNLGLSSLLRSSAKLVEEQKFHQRMYMTMYKLSQYVVLKHNTSFGGSFKMNEVSSTATATDPTGNGVTPAYNYKPPAARGGGVAACLLLKDDNGQLVEWLAYHYHTLPLRYLVVATDPTSVTSPLEVLQRWNNTMGMDIQLWDEPVYFPLSVRKDDAEKLKKNKTSPMWVHRDRQAFFLKKCMLHHKRHARTWTLLIDSDEYLMFNRIATDDDPKRYKPVVDVEEGMYEYKPMKWPKGGNPRNFPANELQQFLRIYIPVTIGETTVHQYIKELPDSPYKKRPCITIPRLLISGQEQNSTSILYKQVPNGFNPKNFNTLRFFYHGKKGSYNVNKFGKSIVDVSRVKERSLFGRTIAWGHRPLRECGPPAAEKPPHETSLLRINHYLGSMEAFLSRTDERRSVQKYLNNSKNKPLLSYDMQGWLRSFVHEVGYEKAKELLQGVGKFEIALNKNTLQSEEADDDNVDFTAPPEIDVLDSSANF